MTAIADSAGGAGETVLVAGRAGLATEVVDAARARDPDETHIVVNSGAPAPVPAGVLVNPGDRGETVVEAVESATCTGVEKNLEYRYWTPGRHLRDEWITCHRFQREPPTASAWRSCSASPMRYPKRVSVIRVLMMELSRISSHLVALATGGMELGAAAPCSSALSGHGSCSLFEKITGLRMNAPPDRRRGAGLAA